MGKWEDLSIRDKAGLIKIYVSGGVMDLSSMKRHYNSFAEGGPKDKDKYIDESDPNFIGPVTPRDIAVRNSTKKFYSNMYNNIASKYDEKYPNIAYFIRESGKLRGDRYGKNEADFLFYNDGDIINLTGTKNSNVPVAKSVLDSLALHGAKSGVSPHVAFGLPAQETKFGFYPTAYWGPEDMREYVKSNPRGYALDDNGSGVTPVELFNDSAYTNEPYGNTISYVAKKLGVGYPTTDSTYDLRGDLTDEQLSKVEAELAKGRGYADRQAAKLEEPGNVFEHAFNLYKSGKYNPGDANYSSAVENAGADVFSSPEFVRWWNESGRKYYEKHAPNLLNEFAGGGDIDPDNEHDNTSKEKGAGFIWDPNDVLYKEPVKPAVQKTKTEVPVKQEDPSKQIPSSSEVLSRYGIDTSGFNPYDTMISIMPKTEFNRDVLVPEEPFIVSSGGIELGKEITLPKMYTKNEFAEMANAASDQATKYFDAKGKTTAQIKEMQQMMADAGGYSQMLEGLSEDAIKEIQRKLVSKGFLSNAKDSDGSYKEVDGIVGDKTIDAWNRYNVDGKWGDRSSSAYNSTIGKEKTSYSWGADFPTKGIDGCAAWVTRKFESVAGEQSAQSGVVGNAWQMPMNVVDKGGEMIFNIYENGFDNIKSVADLKARTNKALKENKFDISQLRPGDVVGIYYPGSSHHMDTIMEGTTYNTHVGIVTGYDNDGTPIIEHNMGGSHKKNRADRIPIGDIAVVARPKFSQQVHEYPFEEKPSKFSIDLSKVTSNVKQEYADKLDTFMNSMAGASNVIGRIYQNADMDEVQKIALAVLGRETNFMQNTESSRTGVDKAKVKIEKLLRNITGATTAETKSSDLTKFKFSTLNAAERQWLGIQSPEDLEKPEKAGLASLLILARNYDYFKRYSEMNPYLEITDQDIADLTALSYNQGITSLKNIGGTSLGDRVVANKGKLEGIRRLAENEGAIEDFSATKLGRVAEEIPILEPAMRGLFNMGLGTRSTSYMQSARKNKKLITKKK